MKGGDIGILVVGGSGFVGTAVARDLATREGVRVRWTTHKTKPAFARTDDDLFEADLRVPETLSGVTRDIDAVIHLGHLLSGPPDVLSAVNEYGAAVLSEEAQRTNSRIVALSTAAVYGSGPWEGSEVHALPEAATSFVSKTRAAGDAYVLEAGGLILRPHLVLGPGDRWVLPRAADLVAEFGWIGGRDALHTTIRVEHLGRRLVDAAIDAHSPGGIELAADPPIRLSEVVEGELRRQGRSPFPLTMTLEQALSRSAGDTNRLAHDLVLLTRPHHLTCNCGNADQSPPRADH